MQKIVVGSNAFLSMPIDQPPATPANGLAANKLPTPSGWLERGQEANAIQALAEALDDSYLQTNTFFAEIVAGARPDIHRDHYSADLGKTALMSEVVLSALHEGWLEALLKSIERQLEPPNGRFRESGPVQDRLRNAIAGARQELPNYTIHRGPSPRPSPWALAAFALVAVGLTAWTFFGDTAGKEDPPALQLAPLTTLHFRPMTEAPAPDKPQSTAWTKSRVAIAVENVTLSAPAESAITYQIQEISLILTLDDRRLNYMWLQFVSLDEICVDLCKESDVNAFDVNSGSGFSRDIMFAAASSADSIAWQDYVEALRTATSVGVKVSIKYTRHALGQASRTISTACTVPVTWLNEFREHPRFKDRTIFPEFLHVRVCQPSSPF